MVRTSKVVLIWIFCLVVFTTAVWAAVGCTLNDPDRDVKRLFPESTGYKTQFITIKERGGEELKDEIEERLGDKFDTVYESIDIPYAHYDVLKGKELIGRIHGVNQKGIYGGIQIILATDLEGKIIGFYYQKISSPEARKFKDKEFTKKFIGLTLADFYRYGLDEPNDRISNIKDPSEKHHDDFKATLRGIKKSLILLDKFKLNDRYSDYFNKEEK